MDRFTLELSGKWFELQVADEINRRFPEFVVLHDLELSSQFLTVWKGKEGKQSLSTQIDLLVITPYCVYVVEAKKWGIEIRGNRDDHYWVGKSNKGNFLRTISPIDQNLTHARALRNLLRRHNHVDLPDFGRYVVVPNGTSILTNCTEVMTFSKLLYKIQRDYMNYKSGKVIPSMIIDVKHWEKIISDVIRSERREVSSYQRQ